MLHILSKGIYKIFVKFYYGNDFGRESKLEVAQAIHQSTVDNEKINKIKVNLI